MLIDEWFFHDFTNQSTNTVVCGIDVHPIAAGHLECIINDIKIYSFSAIL